MLVDNQVLFRHGIKAAVGAEPSIDIVGEAETAAEAVERAAALQPDLVVLEVELPTGGAISAIRTIRERSPRTQVLVLTSCADEETFRRAAAAGAVGYVLKDIVPANLVNAVRAAYGGKTMLSPTIAGLLVHRYFEAALHGDKPDERADEDPKSVLTAHELEVLAGVVQGLSDKRIAANLFVSEATVKTRLRSIYQKLGVRNRAHAAVYAVERGLVAFPCLLAILATLLAQFHMPPWA